MDQTNSRIKASASVRLRVLPVMRRAVRAELAEALDVAEVDGRAAALAWFDAQTAAFLAPDRDRSRRMPFLRLGRRRTLRTDMRSMLEEALDLAASEGCAGALAWFDAETAVLLASARASALLEAR
jgi:hypothetical protein